MTKKPYNICIVHPEGYVHSLTYIEIADLLKHSLRELGYEAETRFNAVDANSINVVMGVQLLERKNAEVIPKDSIILNTEQLSGMKDANFAPDEYREWYRRVMSFLEGGFRVWDYSDDNISFLSEVGIGDVGKLRFGYQKELKRIVHSPEKDVDVLFYGSVNPRRKKILDEMAERGLRTKILFGVYGKERDQWIGRSKLILNHHLLDSHIFEVTRVFYLQTNSLAILAEVNSTTSVEERWLSGLDKAEYGDLVERACELVANEALLERLREKSFAAIEPWPQAEFTKNLVQS